MLERCARGTGMRDIDMKAVRGVAAFDLLVTLPMAVPGLSEYYAAWLLSGFGLLQSPADWLPLPLSTAIFVVLAGILALLWNGARALQPQLAVLVRGDCAGRCAVAAAFAYFLLVRDAPAILWLFVATELGGAAIEARVLLRTRMQR
jgi:hypothetical protein